MILVRIATTMAAGLLLAACSSMPLPANVDLRARLGDAVTDTTEVPVQEGSQEELEITLPGSGGQCVDVPRQALPVTVQSAELHWNFDLDYEGPDLTGRVQARLFVAGPDEDLFHPRNTLGPTVTVNLDRATTRLAGTASLRPDQLEAIADRTVCWGVQLTGDDVRVAESGFATIGYEVHELWMHIRFSVI